MKAPPSLTLSTKPKPTDRAHRHGLHEPDSSFREIIYNGRSREQEPADHERQVRRPSQPPRRLERQHFRQDPPSYDALRHDPGDLEHEEEERTGPGLGRFDLAVAPSGVEEAAEEEGDEGFYDATRLCVTLQSLGQAGREPAGGLGESETEELVPPCCPAARKAVVQHAGGRPELVGVEPGRVKRCLCQRPGDPWKGDGQPEKYDRIKGCHEVNGHENAETTEK